VPGPADLRWDVFTVAFRKINSGEVSLAGKSTFQWDWKDRIGARVANGLYYLRLEVNGEYGTVKRIYKILNLE
jgi:hypothetical protein